MLRLVCAPTFRFWLTFLSLTKFPHFRIRWMTERVLWSNFIWIFSIFCAIPLSILYACVQRAISGIMAAAAYCLRHACLIWLLIADVDELMILAGLIEMISWVGKSWRWKRCSTQNHGWTRNCTRYHMHLYGSYVYIMSEIGNKWYSTYSWLLRRLTWF